MVDVKAHTSVTAIMALTVLFGGIVSASTPPASAWADMTPAQVELDHLDVENLYGPEWQDIAKVRHAGLAQDGRLATGNADLIEAAKKDAINTWIARAASGSVSYNNGENVVPTIRFRYAGTSREYVPESLYKVVSCSSVSKPGEKGTIKVAAAWDETITRTLKFAVRPANISSSKVTKPYEIIYNGNEVKPGIELVYNGVKLIEGTDYELVYSNNIEIGTARIDVHGIGNFRGAGYCTFEIVPAQTTENEDVGNEDDGYTEQGTTSNSEDKSKKTSSTSLTPVAPKIITKSSISPIKARYTTGLSKVKPAVVVTVGGKTLKQGTDYTVTYKNNKKPGTAKATVKGRRGAYSGSATVSFKLVNLGNPLAKAGVRLSYSQGKRYNTGNKKYPGTNSYLKAWAKNGKPNHDKYKGRTCGAGVAVVLRSSGYDAHMTGTANASLTYLKKSRKWTLIGKYNAGKSTSQNHLQAGDVLVRHGHIWMFIGTDLARSVYKAEVKGRGEENGDTGTPQGPWLSAHLGNKGSTGAAPGLGNDSWAYANYGSSPIYIYRCTVPDNTAYRHGGIVK